MLIVIAVELGLIAFAGFAVAGHLLRIRGELERANDHYGIGREPDEVHADEPS